MASSFSPSDNPEGSVFVIDIFVPVRENNGVTSTLFAGIVNWNPFDVAVAVI